MASQQEVVCPYCHTTNSLATTGTTRVLKLDLKVFSVEKSQSKTAQATRVRCRFCGRRYEILPITDYSWVRRRLYLSDSALISFKSIYAVAQVDLDDLLSSATAVTKVSKNRFHICIKKVDIASYVDCHYDKRADRLTGEEVQRLT